jgi:hypothetical protein
MGLNFTAPMTAAGLCGESGGRLEVDPAIQIPAEVGPAISRPTSRHRSNILILRYFRSTIIRRAFGAAPLAGGNP